MVAVLQQEGTYKLQDSSSQELGLDTTDLNISLDLAKNKQTALTKRSIYRSVGQQWTPVKTE